MQRIEKIIARPLELPLKEPFETAQRRATTSPMVLVQLIAGDIVGYGEATPVRYVTGEDINTVMLDIAAASEALEGASLSEYRLSAQKLAKVLPYGKSARAGIEMAMMDALGKSLQIPLYALLGGAPLRIETDVTIPICPPEHAKELAVELGAKGFRQFKVKVGKDAEEDTARVMAIAEGVPGCLFNLDANQGFTAGKAVDFTRKLTAKGIKINLLEQPVACFDFESMRYVTDNAGVPVYADEDVQSPADAIEIVRHRAAHGINVKIMKAGMLGALEIKSICKAAGLKLMFGCMLESKIGQSASAHIACGTAAFTVYDLDSDLLLGEGQPVTGGIERHGPILKISNRPGLGCEVLESAL